MADFNEIKKAFYELVESYADAPESAETKSKIADFAKLLPADKEEQHNTLKNLDAAVRADVRIPGRINLPAAVKKNIGTLLSGLQKHMTAKQPDKPAQNDDKPKKQPEKADNKRPNLSPEEFKEKLNKLYKVFMNSLEKTDVNAVDESLSRDDKDLRGYVRNLRKQIADNTDFNLDGISNGPILKTIRRALKKYKEKQKNNESERKPRPEKKDHKKKGGPDMAEDKVNTDGTEVEFGEENTRPTASLEATNPPGRIHTDETDDDIAAKELKAKKKQTNEGGDDKDKDMADEKKITDEMKEKLKKLGLSDEEIGALSYDAAAEKLKTNEGGDDKPKDGDDKPKDGDDKDKDKDKDAPEEESTPKDPTAPIGVTEKPSEEREEHTDEKAPWVIRKQKWFDENIKPSNEDYKVTRADTEFEVQFAGGTIHYENETKAVVSKDASYKVYEALLKEPDNAQRPVKFPEDASEHLTNMLYAASILNETPDGKPHEMQGLDKSKLNMEAIEKALKEAGYGDAEVKKVKDYYAAHEGKPAAEDEHSHDDHGVELSDVVKDVKAEDFKRGTGTNSMKFSPNGTYNLESGEVRIDAVDKEPKVVYYSGTAPTGLPADVKAEPLKDEEVNHIKEQAKPAIEKEVRDILDRRDKMKELADGGLITIEKLPDGTPLVTAKDSNNEGAKKAATEYQQLMVTQPQDNAFVAQVISKEPDLITKIHSDEATKQPQKDILIEKMNSYNNVSELLKQRAELLDKGEDKLEAKEKVALTKNYVALFAEYKKDPTLVETAMADDLKRGEKTVGRTKAHEDVQVMHSEYDEYYATMKDYSAKAHAVAKSDHPLKLQDYMKDRYPDMKPEELDKRIKRQVQFNSAYNRYTKQQAQEK